MNRVRLEDGPPEFGRLNRRRDAAGFRARRGRQSGFKRSPHHTVPDDFVRGVELQSCGESAIHKLARSRLCDLAQGAAEHVSAESGYREACIVRITERAGVRRGRFCLYFSSKQVIFGALVSPSTAGFAGLHGIPRATSSRRSC